MHCAYNNQCDSALCKNSKQQQLKTGLEKFPKLKEAERP